MRSARPARGVFVLTAMLSLFYADSALAGDPAAKLADAEYLLTHEGRVMQARREIDAVIADCQPKNDTACLANAYRLYGILARYGGSKDNPTILNLHPDAPPHPSAEEFDISDGYFEQALTLYRQTQQLDLVANVSFMLAMNQMARGAPLKACPYLDQAGVALADARKQHPEKKITDVPGQASPEEGLAAAKKSAGCPAG
ncbi:MAG TPA: hypothetical protein VMF58_07825 [Rhizomicrobium sp.]|nr:hypothetical protein [Rhizomicrobium sp.]